MTSMHKRALGVLTAALLLSGTALTCKPKDKDNRLKREWTKASKKACLSTAAIIGKLHQSAARFEKTYEEELARTRQGKKDLAYFNPRLFERLKAKAAAFDTTNPALKARLEREVWTTHYRFVKGAGDVLPRLHTYLALLQQLNAAVDTGAAMQKKFESLLRMLTPKAQKTKSPNKPQFGVLILADDRHVLFADMGKPCESKPGKEPAGYILPNGQCGKFPESNRDRAEGTIRVFRNHDELLFNRLKCTGQEYVVMKAWRYSVIQIRVLLAKLKEIDAPDLKSRFEASAR